MITNQKNKISTVNDPAYKGKMSNYQTNVSKYNGINYSTDCNFNTYQIMLYNRALHGISIYSEEELKTMSLKKKERIIKVHKRSIRILNIWKQQIVNKWSTNFFEKFFPTSPITRDIKKTKDLVDPRFINKMSFKSLGISQRQIIFKLVVEGVLPSNFYELNKNNLCK